MEIEALDRFAALAMTEIIRLALPAHSSLRAQRSNPVFHL